MMRNCILSAALAAQALAAPTEPSWATLQKRQAVAPQLKQTTYLGNVTDPAVDRDSCGSVRIGKRNLWTCRDSLYYNSVTSLTQLPVIVNSAAWTDRTSTGPVIKTVAAPLGDGSAGNPIMQMYGGTTPITTEYYPLTASECNGNHGFCSDGSRWVIWPDQPPLLTSSTSTTAVAYSWIPKYNIRGLTSLTPTPACSLYKSTYKTSQGTTALPTVTLVNENFWNTGELNFGDYGSMTSGGYAYLYARNANYGIMVARTKVIENRAKYTYWNSTSSTWSATLPSINDTSNLFPLGPGGIMGQGTFYYSTAFKSYVWMGQAFLEVVANFWIATAPSPQGPWSAPYQIWAGKNGDNPYVPSYSLQAHPGLLPSANAAEKAIYLTWTQQWADATYTTPLVYMEFQ